MLETQPFLGTSIGRPARGLTLLKAFQSSAAPGVETVFSIDRGANFQGTVYHWIFAAGALVGVTPPAFSNYWTSRYRIVSRCNGTDWSTSVAEAYQIENFTPNLILSYANAGSNMLIQIDTGTNVIDFSGHYHAVRSDESA